MLIQSGPDFLKVIAATPLVSVDLVLTNPAQEVLLGKRVNRPAQGYWFVPGGRITKNEPIAAAIERVSATEIGTALTIDQMQLIGAFDHIYPDNYFGDPDVNTHYVVITFGAQLPTDTKIVIDPQHTEMRWWPIDAMLRSPQVHPYTRRYFQ